MKKFVFLFIMMPLLSFSQKKNLKGIGDFQIGKTNISIIDSLINRGFVEEKCRSYYMCVRNTAGGKFILTPLDDQIGKPLFDDYKVFWIANYSISDIMIYDMKVSFYKGVLFSIEIDGSVELLEALKLIYNYTESKKYKTITCSNIFGQIKKEEWVFTTNFSKDPNFKAFEESQKYYNDDCEEKHLSILEIYDVKTQKIIDAKQESLLTKKNIEEERLLKEKYKDL